jgi:UDP-galactopyranose mutase
MKVLIVGSGLSGATVANVLAKNGHHITVIDSRSHVGGNIYDYKAECGTRIHKYGPHIFHTSNHRVVKFLTQFTSWIPYVHRVRALGPDGKLYPFPPNSDVRSYFTEDEIFDTFYKPYTKKMWGLSVEQLDKSILARVPQSEGSETRYFPKDSFQGLPKDGYTRLIENMLDDKHITVITNTRFDRKLEAGFNFIFNSMAVDEYFDYDMGALPYRSMLFHTVTLPVDRLSYFAQVNYTIHEKFTRYIEWKNFPEHGGHSGQTTVTFEEPCDSAFNGRERYYPIKDLRGINRNLYSKYLSMAPSNMFFIGRLGNYAYLNMDQAVNSAHSIATNFLREHQQ